MSNILAMVLAGGESAGLYPLTIERSTPALPFAGRYRVVDFVLSNLVNSGIHSIYLLVQYKSQSLIEHINKGWVLSHIPGHFITVVPPQMREGPAWFQGTANAIFQNINLIELVQPDMVAVFGADHIYRMDVRQMVEFHRRRGAAVSIAAIPIPLKEASAFGIIDADADGRIRGFLEKPEHPPAMAGDATRAYGSMGNYLFETEVLLRALHEAKRRGESDFGRHILPRMIETHGIYAYDFAQNRVPGIRDYEDPGYWRDVGTIDAYFEANQDGLGAEPRFDLHNPHWLINSSNYQGPTAQVIGGVIENSSIGAGSIIKGGVVRNSVLRREVVIEEDAHLEDCIIMDYAVIGRGAKLRRVILDRYNTIEPGARIGYDAAADARRYLVTESGLVVVGKQQREVGSVHYQH